MSVTKIRVTAPRLQKAIRAAAKDSSKVAFIPPLEKRSMAGMMTFHQALMCLQHGDIVGKPVLNERGDWELSMQRFAANFMFEMRVVVSCKGANVDMIYVFPGSGD